MDIPKVYLETTMFNFLFVPDKPGYAKLKADVEAVFALVKEGKFDPYTSIYATDELDDTVTDERRERMKQVILPMRRTLLSLRLTDWTLLSASTLST
jgi:hypothetical protein